MKNIVLVTHGEFATGIVTSLELVYGKSENLETVTIHSSETLKEIIKNIQDKITGFNNNLPTVIITDIAGGSTTQAALEILSSNENTYLLTGLSLGLLLEVVLADMTDSDEENKEILREIIENTRQTINFVNDLSENEMEESEDGEL
ncbi:MAG: hypothetical protein KHZ27_07750 [Fusobacterium sp.]|uniref:PTS sugar transporter subunit IIA n=1 Tax=Fusobacterium sp. SB021 TaxID=2744227 RepID=UPI001D7584E7|nr:hypothetical protein [Fusobacterium sp.]